MRLPSFSASPWPASVRSRSQSVRSQQFAGVSTGEPSASKPPNRLAVIDTFEPPKPSDFGLPDDPNVPIPHTEISLRHLFPEEADKARDEWNAIWTKHNQQMAPLLESLQGLLNRAEQEIEPAIPPRKTSPSLSDGRADHSKTAQSGTTGSPFIKGRRLSSGERKETP